MFRRSNCSKKYNVWQISQYFCNLTLYFSKVAPSELEAILLQHPAVKDVGVIGIPDTLAGEIPTAFIVKQVGASIAERDIVEFVKSKVRLYPISQYPPCKEAMSISRKANRKKRK